MLTSNVQLGYLLTRGGGQAVQGSLSCPPPRISERMDNPQILLHHLLQEYSVERDINFTEMLTSNVQLDCLDSLPPTPRTRITELNVRCKHLSLSEIMFTSLTTKYSKIMVQ